MNISLFDQFIKYKNQYQIIYLLFIILLIGILVLELLFFHNIISLDYKGVISKNNQLVISNLAYSEVEAILNSKRIEYNGKFLKYKVIETKKGVNDYILKLKLDNYYLDSRTLNLKVILQEENFYQFIIRKMKGE